MDGSSGVFFGGDAPHMSDYFAYESIDRGRDVFGPAFERLLADCPRLATLADALDESPRLRAARERGAVFERISGSPSGLELQRRVRALAPSL